jgi:hypothetical protein
MTDKPRSPGEKAGLVTGAALTSGRVRLFVIAVVFIGWLSYLGYAALVKNRGPVISRAQAAAATHKIVADVKPGPDGKPQHRVTVVKVLDGDGVTPNTDLFISNLANVQGFDGSGHYLLLLVADPRAQDHKLNTDQLPAFAVMGQQRSPGNDLAGVGPPLVYRWTDEVRKQFEKMPKKE